MIIKIISKNTDLSPVYIAKVVKSASHLYKNYLIKKRKKGKRLISHPAKELKLLQRWMIDNILSHLPIHKSVFSYKKGIGIQNLANVHRKNNFLLRTDFKDFFPSIKSNNIANLIQKNLSLINFQLSNKDIEIICKVVCKDGKLTIGAPSSPIISNSILYDFDEHWFEKCKKQNIVYSRYADDLYFSTNHSHKLKLVYKELIDYVNRMKSPYLELNKNKTVFTSKKYRRIVTGLVLTPKGEISIGRQKKRFIKSLIHKCINQDISDKQLSYLRGYLAYINAVEPTFVKRLENKYGKDIIKNILSNEIDKIANI